jgi:hypothetical protein
MAAKGDVKAVQITAAAQVFAGRTRLRGIILSKCNYYNNYRFCNFTR